MRLVFRYKHAGATTTLNARFNIEAKLRTESANGDVAALRSIFRDRGIPINRRVTVVHIHIYLHM